MKVEGMDEEKNEGRKREEKKEKVRSTNKNARVK